MTIHMGIKSSSLSSKLMRRAIHIFAAEAQQCDTWKICLKEDTITKKVVTLLGSFLVFLPTLISWIWHFSTVSKWWNFMKTFRITNFPLSKFYTLLYRTNKFSTATQIISVWETIKSQTQAFLFSNPSAIHNLGLDKLYGIILSILCRTKKLQRLQ